MSLALLTVLASNPCLATEWKDHSSIVWTLDASLMDNRPARLEVLGTPGGGTLGELAGLVFDGVDDALEVDCNPLEGAAAFTVEVLLAPEKGGPAEQRFFHIQEDGERRLLLELRMVTPETWALDTYLSEDKDRRLTLLDRGKVHPAGVWHWVALRYDGTTLSHFVNGTCEAEGPIDVRPMTRGRTSIGMRLNRVSWYQGLLREVRFHRTALAAEVLQRR